MKKLMMAVCACVCAVGAMAESTVNYVSDGLIAVWDGYENNGAGGHATELTEWKDTTGQYSFVFNASSGITVDSASLVFAGVNACYATLDATGTAATFDLTKNGTMEIVFKAAADRASKSILVRSSGTSGIAAGNWNSQTSWIVSNNSSPTLVLDGRGELTTLVIHYANGVASAPYVNGQPVKTASNNYFGGSVGSITTIGADGHNNSNFKGNPFKGEIYAIRLYSTPLTPEQIAENRAVDVKRLVEGDFTRKFTCTWEASRYVCADGVDEAVTAKVSGDKTGLQCFWKIDGGDFEEGDLQRRIVFDAAGDHTVTLKVTNAVGEEAVCSHAFTVVARNDYKYAVEFTAPEVTAADGFENIPVPIRLRNDDTKFAYSKMAFPESGKDIEFYDLSGNKLPHEIESWDPEGVSTVWVKLPKLETGVKFRMAFGCDDEDKIVPSTVSDIWTGYQAVWHMNGMNATADDLTTTPDSTANKMDAVVRNTTVSTVAADGAIASALVCDINTTKKKAGFVVPNSRELWDTGDFTLSAWIRRPSGASWAGEVPFSTKATITADTGGFSFSRWNLDHEIGLVTRGSTRFGVQQCNMNDKNWFLFTLTYVNGTLNFYRNGARIGGNLTVTNYEAAENDFAIGTFPGDADVLSWRGDFDEVRWVKGAGLSAQRIAIDYATQVNADYFDIQGISHGNSRTVTVTKYIPELELDLALPECHQKYLTDTNYVFTCSADPGDLYFTTNDVAYKCVGYVFTSVSGDSIVGDTTTFTFQPATMGEGVLQWQFAAVGYRTRVHAIPPFLADKAEITVTPDSVANRVFDCYYRAGTVLTVALTEKEEGAFEGWRGAAGEALEDKTAKTVTYTVGATGSNPDLVASVCGIVDTDDDLRIASDNCARTPAVTYIYLATDGNDANNGLTPTTAVKTPSKAFALAKAVYAANLGPSVILVGAGDYSASGLAGCALDFPVVFEGGFGNPKLTTANTYVQGACWYNLSSPRAAIRRLTLAGVDPWGAKVAGLVSVAAGMLEGVTVTNGLSGADYNPGSGVVWISGSGVVTNCLVTNCRAPCPGTMKTTSGIVNIKSGLLAGTRITHCSSEATDMGVGGGVYVAGGTVRNCLIDNCTAYTEGSGMYISPSSACTVENCTIVDCGPCVAKGSAASTYGVYMTGSSAAKSCTFVNNIVYGNSGASSTQIDKLNLNRANETYTYLRNNVFDVQIPDSATASGNIAGNPAFTDRSNGDYSTGKGAGTDRGEDLAWAHDEYAKDLAGNPRILGEGLDVGCYEYVPSDKLDVTVNLILPEEVKVGAVVTLSAEASGGAGDYVYAWFVDGVQIVSGAEYATYDYTIASAGVHDVKCVVTDGAGATVEKEESGALRVYVRHGYVSKTGSNTSPYDTPETAADNFDAVLAILDPGGDVEVSVGPGEYEVTNVITFAQKTYFHSTDGSEKTVLRPSAGTSCFACNGNGTVVEGFTITGMSGSANAIKVLRTASVKDIRIRNCNLTSYAVWAQNSLTTENLTLYAVTNSGTIYRAETSGSDSHRNLTVTDCSAGGQFLYAGGHGVVIKNGLFLRVKTGSELIWTQCSGEAISWRNVTIDDCVVGGGCVFNSNVSWNPNYLRNCVVGRVWTTTAKTALRAPLHNGEHCINCCFLAPAKASANEWVNSFDETDPRLKSRGRLKGSSPCRGTGDPSFWTATDTDIIGNPRLHVDKAGAYTVDMGCYENDPPGLLLLLK